MTEDRDTTASVDTSRLLNRARAALREAAENLEDAAAVSEHPSLSLASAMAHVGAARKALRPHGLREHAGDSEADAA